MRKQNPTNNFNGPVRTADESDAGEIRDLYRNAFASDAGRLGYRPSPMDTDYGILFKQNFVLVLGAPGDIVGAAVTSPRNGYLYVEAFAVAPGYQRRGLGAGLMAGVEHLASELCLPEIRLHTAPLLSEAIRFYLACGFREVDRTGHGAMSRVLFSRSFPTLLDRVLQGADPTIRTKLR